MNELINEQRERIAHLERINDGLTIVIEKMKLAARELGYDNSMTCSELDYLVETARAVVMVNQKNFELVADSDHVSVPKTADEAAMMAIIGMKWLEDNSPDKLTELHRNVKADAVMGILKFNGENAFSSDGHIYVATVYRYAEILKQGDSQ